MSYRLILAPYLYTIVFNLVERYYYLIYPRTVHSENVYPVSAYDIDARDYNDLLIELLQYHHWQQGEKLTFILKEELVDL